MASRPRSCWWLLPVRPTGSTGRLVGSPAWCGVACAQFPRRIKGRRPTAQPPRARPQPRRPSPRRSSEPARHHRRPRRPRLDRHPQPGRPGASRALPRRRGHDAYRDAEVIVVDNGSADGSPEFAESFELPFPIRVIRNRTNRSFSEANSQGAAVATGELICFLNNDVDPITDDWLGYLVETTDRPPGRRSRRPSDLPAASRAALGRDPSSPTCRFSMLGLASIEVGVSRSPESWAPEPTRLRRGGRRRGSTRADRRMPACATGCVSPGRRLLTGVRLWNRGCRPVPQAASGWWSLVYDGRARSGITNWRHEY